MIHYIGNIYNFNPEPIKENILIDIPFFDQNPISDEVLINIDDKDIKNRGSEQYNKLNPKDLDNVENIFSDPIDKAAFVVAFYLEMEDEIKN